MLDTISFWVLVLLVGVILILTVPDGSTIANPTPKHLTSLAQRQSALLEAIHFVESGGKDKAPRGEAGEIGPLQIMESYWIDSKVPGSWEDCEDLEYSTRVLNSYMNRWAREAWNSLDSLDDAERVARIHNGGPKGYSKDATEVYWARVLYTLTKSGKEQYFGTTRTDQ